jgi:hypothetical protein
MDHFPPPGRPRGTSAKRPSTSFAMRVRLHLKPGQKGTKQLLAEYGDRLVCVRYRYDAERGKRFKTVELIVGEKTWAPHPSRQDDRIVAIRIAFQETALRDHAKRAGGTWNPDRRLWELPYRQAVRAGLADRIVTTQASTDRCREPRAEYRCRAPVRHLSGDAGLHGWIRASIARCWA